MQSKDNKPCAAVVLLKHSGCREYLADPDASRGGLCKRASTDTFFSLTLNDKVKVTNCTDIEDNARKRGSMHIYLG